MTAGRADDRLADRNMRDPGKFGITPGTAAALAAVVDEMNVRL